MSANKVRVVVATGHEPWLNQAIEACILDNVVQGEVVLYLWQNDHTVFIGRNQNPWRECRCQLLEADGGHLARRKSGGGAVYHDLGNLNFSFILDRSLYDFNRQLKVILAALQNLGIGAEFQGRNDLTVANKKFSGHAYYQTECAALHHGTILIHTDFHKLNRYLQVAADKLQAKAITSVQARVINLQELSPHVTVAGVKDSLLAAFSHIFGPVDEITVLAEQVTELQGSSLAPYYDNFARWDWRYGETPDFQYTNNKRFSWGGVEVGFVIEEGLITQCKIYSDALDTTLLKDAALALQGAYFTFAGVRSRLEVLMDRPHANELVDWLCTGIP